MLLLLPNFQRSFGFSKPPFLSGCKGKSLYFCDQNYLKKFQTFLTEINHFKNYRFLTGCKDKEVFF
jgi:hypothetical protein